MIALVVLQLLSQDFALPPAYLQFCATQPAAHCEVERVSLEDIAHINATVNAAIKPRADIKDRWTIWPEEGADCDDYVVTKRAILIAFGLDPKTMRISMGEVKQGKTWTTHVVLEVDINGATWILDNLASGFLYTPTSRPNPWRGIATEADSVTWSITK